MRISVCIPSIRSETLANAVRSVRRQTFADWELIVVGQGAEAQLRATTLDAADGDARVRYLHLDRMGACAARNTAMKAASGEIIAFMDDDCEADERWLATLDECFDSDVELVSGSVIPPAKARRLFAVCPTVEPADVVWDTARADDQPPPGFGLLGANMALRRWAAEHVGSFDECLGPGSRFGGGEEHDYAVRLAQLGVRMRSTPSSIVHHTYGYRYGLRAVYSHKRDRIRGDGALAGKQTLLDARGGDLAVSAHVRALAKAQLRNIRITRLPQGLFRLLYLVTSYRECIKNCRIVDCATVDRAQGVLTEQRGA